jgi:hypothetical protein
MFIEGEKFIGASTEALAFEGTSLVCGCGIKKHANNTATPKAKVNQTIHG